MAGRTRTTKKLAQRIDLNYFKKLRRIPYWRRVASAVLGGLGLLVLCWYAVWSNPKPYNAGALAHAHSQLSQKCDVCHIPRSSAPRYHQAGWNPIWGRRQLVAADEACVACHDGPEHHAEQTFAPACSDCHVEHKGAMRLASTSERACTQCHDSLRDHDKNPPKVEANISGFDRHPEFKAVQKKHDDPGTVAFNHMKHLKKELRGPRGSIVELKCVDCHRPAGAIERLRFGQAQAASIPATPFTTLPDRAYMAPVNYMEHCSACHTLEFDKRIQEPAPHKEPKVVYDFIVKKLTEYIAAHPGAIHILDEPDKRLPPRPVPPAPRNAQEWVAQRLADSQILMWRKACKECHGPPSFPPGQSLPAIAKAAIPVRWLPKGNFDHEAHQMVKCTECHAAAQKSEMTSDVLVPGIQVCRQCHHSGSEAAEARCFECHTYHDWRKEKQVAGEFTVRKLN